MSEIEIHPFGSRLLLVVAFLVFIALGVVVFMDPLMSSFLSDDFVILKAVEQDGAFGIWSNRDADFFRPLSSFIFYLKHTVWSLNAFPFHLANVLVHSVSSFLVCLLAYLILRETGHPRELRRLLSIAAGLIFLVLPCHSEPVSWIAAGIDLYAALFALASLFTYLWYRNVRLKALLPVSAAFLGLSLLCKESAIGLPLVLIAYEVYLRISRRWRLSEPYSDLRLPIVHVVVACLYLLLRRASLGTFIGGYGAGVHLRVTPLRIAAGLALQPTRTYLPPMPGRIVGVAVFAGIVLVVLAFILIKHFRKKRSLPAVVLLVLVSYLLLLLPVMNLSVHAVDTQGERFVYLASALGVILLVILLAYLIEGRRWLIGILAALVIVYAGFLYRSNHNWSRASRVSESVMASLSTLGETGDVYILNLPDNIGGAYIFRNGLNESAELIGYGAGHGSLKPVFWQELGREDDTVDVTEGGGGYLVEVSGAGSRLRNRRVSADGTLESEGFRITDAGPYSYRVTFTSAAGNARICVYEGGRLVSLGRTGGS